ncbi:MAG: translation initiation factor IF-2 [Nanoarchaeota archaeon]|nr:translation initiation factor IF-2 [Nanoarchaeota archaeon]
MAKIRAPICTLVGHVDHGKTSILDWIRGTSIARGEAGGITQAISSTNLSINVINQVCGDMLKTLKCNITLPGILFIDTPGHAAFTNLRKRGGNLADIAILVIDLNESFKPQTFECIEILKQYKTPFVVAANKVDLIPGWKPNKKKALLANLKDQSMNVQQEIDKKLYELVGKLHELDFASERFDRIDDYTKQIAMVPVSAKTGEGLPELLMVLTGIAQKFLEQCLKCNVEGLAKGTVLEVKEEKGLGTTIDVIVYDGTVKKGDLFVVGGLEKPVVSKVKILLELEKKKLKQVKEVSAATGVKIAAPDIKDIIPGMPLRVTSKKDLEKTKLEIQEEVEEVLVETDNDGIVIKADSLGSLEALITLLKEADISIKHASIGNISKKDIMEASAEKDPLNKVVIGFNVNVLEESKEVKIIVHDVIYKIIEDISAWRESERKRLEAKELEGLAKPCKLQIIAGCIFRQNNPAVVGVEVLLGTATLGVHLMKPDGSKISEIKSIQLEGENMQEAEKGKQVAISLPHITVGRQIFENDILLSDIPEDDFVKFKQFKKYLKNDEIILLKEIAEIKRREHPVWGV